MARGKYAKLPDLFTEGTEIVFPNRDVMWLQVLNPFEVDEARKDAQAAKSRLILALREIGSADYDTMKGAFYSAERDLIIAEMLTAKHAEFYVKSQTEVMDDPDWRERLEIARRFDETPPVDDAEEKLLQKINTDFLTEVNKRTDDERAYWQRTWEKLSEDDLFEDYAELWLGAKGQEVALKAYNITELYYGARVCEAEPTQDGQFNERSHTNCNGHRERVYESKDEVRTLPKGMLQLLREGYSKLAISERDARFSPRQESSSASSPLPSAEVESTPSTPDATSTGAPGTSTPPSTTP